MSNDIKMNRLAGLPESFTSMKAKMNSKVPYAIEQMNIALEQMCESASTKPKDKLKATQDYLGMYIQLQNQIAKESQEREMSKQRKLNTIIKQAEVAGLEDGEDKDLAPIAQSNFSPSMSVS